MTKRKIQISLVLFLLVFTVMAKEWSVPRLSPLPVKQEIQELTLNGKWKFSAVLEKDFWNITDTRQWSDIEVPGQWVMQGYEVERGKTAGYFRTFSVPASWKNKRIKLRCNGIFSESTIYINGNKAGYHLGGFTPFELDITSLVKTGEENRIVASVISESLADSTASASQYATHSLGGIVRDIFLFALPDVNLSSFHVSTIFDNNYTNATLIAEVEVSNESSATENASLIFTLTDSSGKEIKLTNNRMEVKDLKGRENRSLKISFDVTKPEQWNSEHPYLYNFTCQLKNDDRILHSTNRRVGFRQIEVRGNEMFINNKPVKLRGVCRHEVMPLRGRSVIGDTWRKDVELFKKGNVNLLRTSHYPPDEALMEACDELGMFVELEAPFCWSHGTKIPEDKHYLLMVNQHLEMVNRDRSHPSVIIWSLGNESNFYKEHYKRSGEIIKEIDPTRPRIFSQGELNADNNELEIGSLHYPGIEGPNRYRNSTRPVVFDEFCHLNAYNRFELSADPGLRTMWGPLLDDMWNNMYYSKGVLGGALWAGIDDSFFLPGGKTVGYGTWGPIDGWRREKPEFWEMKKAFSPVRISMKQNIDADGNLFFNIENRFNFTNLSSCEILWRVSDLTGKSEINLDPRANDVFKINLPAELRNSKEISFTIQDSEGYNVDEYNFNLSIELSQSKEKTVNKKIGFSETNNFYTLSSPDVSVRVNKSTGLIDVLKDNKSYLKNAPTLMILPLNGTGDGVQMTGKSQDYEPYNPVCEDWICNKISIEKEKDMIAVIVEGDYQNATGEFKYILTPDEELQISYQFFMKKDVSPRQTGLVFNFPEVFKTLSWERKGYWNVYPQNYIGALKGTTEVLDTKRPVCGIAGPATEPETDWAFDQTKNGSNMFRSTKENIIFATLSSDNMSFTVLSDGLQHARAWKDNENTKLLIADYNNAGGEGFLSSHAGRYFRPLKKGDNVKGMVRISIK